MQRCWGSPAFPQILLNYRIPAPFRFNRSRLTFKAIGHTTPSRSCFQQTIIKYFFLKFSACSNWDINSVDTKPCEPSLNKQHVFPVLWQTLVIIWIWKLKKKKKQTNKQKKPLFRLFLTNCRRQSPRAQLCPDWDLSSPKSVWNDTWQSLSCAGSTLRRKGFSSHLCSSAWTL